MGVEHVLPGGGQFVFKARDPLRRRVACRRGILGQFVHDLGILDILLVFAHLINLDSVCEVTSTMGRSEEHTSELQSLMRTSYAVSCLKNKIHTEKKNTTANEIE